MSETFVSLRLSLNNVSILKTPLIIRNKILGAHVLKFVSSGSREGPGPPLLGKTGKNTFILPLFGGGYDFHIFGGKQKCSAPPRLIWRLFRQFFPHAPSPSSYTLVTIWSSKERSGRKCGMAKTKNKGPTKNMTIPWWIESCHLVLDLVYPREPKNERWMLSSLINEQIGLPTFYPGQLYPGQLYPCTYLNSTYIKSPHKFIHFFQL